MKSSLTPTSRLAKLTGEIKRNGAAQGSDVVGESSVLKYTNFA